MKLFIILSLLSPMAYGQIADAYDADIQKYEREKEKKRRERIIKEAKDRKRAAKEQQRFNKEMYGQKKRKPKLKDLGAHQNRFPASEDQPSTTYDYSNEIPSQRLEKSLGPDPKQQQYEERKKSFQKRMERIREMEKRYGEF